LNNPPHKIKQKQNGFFRVVNPFTDWSAGLMKRIKLEILLIFAFPILLSLNCSKSGKAVQLSDGKDGTVCFPRSATMIHFEATSTDKVRKNLPY
jgi:hypothetical protein